jgi:hypothetical protein
MFLEDPDLKIIVANKERANNMYKETNGRKENILKRARDIYIRVRI